MLSGLKLSNSIVQRKLLLVGVLACVVCVLLLASLRMPGRLSSSTDLGSPISGRVAQRSVFCAAHKAPVKSRTRLRIVIVSSSLPTECGIATFAHEFRNGLLLADDTITVDVIAVVPDEDVSAVFPKHVVHKIRKKNAGDYAEAAQVANERYDYVVLQHEFGVFGGFVGNFLLFFTERLRVPSIAVFHTVRAFDAPQFSIVMHQLMEHTKYHVTLQENGCYSAQLREIHTLFGTKPDMGAKCRWIPHGVPLRKFCSQITVRRSLESKYGWRKDEFIIYSGGRIHPGKNVDKLVIAAGLANARLGGRKIRVVITGSAHNDEDSLRYIKLVRNVCHINGQLCYFIDRFLEQEELTALIQGADLTVLLYNDAQQVSSGVLVMSLALGTPVMATPFQQVIDLQGGGVIKTEATVEDVANHLEALVNDDVRYTKLQLETHPRMVNRDWQSVGYAILNVISTMEGEVGVRFINGVQEPQKAFPMFVIRGPHPVWVLQQFPWLILSKPICLCGDFVVVKGNEGQISKRLFGGGSSYKVSSANERVACLSSDVVVGDRVIAKVEKCIYAEEKGYILMLSARGLIPSYSIVELVVGFDRLAYNAAEAVVKATEKYTQVDIIFDNVPQVHAKFPSACTVRTGSHASAPEYLEHVAVKCPGMNTVHAILDFDKPPQPPAISAA